MVNVGLLGRLLQWSIQAGVTVMGRRVPASADWLQGPVGGARIGSEVYGEVAATLGLTRDEPGEDAGLLRSFAMLRSDRFDPDLVDARIRDFYEQTASYNSMDVWSRWKGPWQILPRLVVAPGQQPDSPVQPASIRVR